MKKIITFVKRNWLIASLSTLIGITILSLWPLNNLPKVPGTDKTHHFIAYTVLMFPVAFSKPKRWILIGVFFIAYSGAIELIQPYVNRYGEWLDLAANAIGVLCGVILAELMTSLLKRLNKF